ncbi:MAG: PAS domain S-box protein, partial [Epsilonproteobacteria bacterium]|nr:PAS domain S-box protein [Campylobacterota bacterium]
MQTDSILIQLFCGDLDTNKVQSILNILKIKLPNAKIIGSSTTGEIFNGVIYENTITISFAIFEKTNLRISYYPKADFQTGVDIANRFLLPSTKAIIAFSETLKQDSELFLEGFNSVENSIVIAGGNAGDNYNFTKTFIICDDKIYFEGLVVCALDSDVLHIHSDYSLEWKTIDNEMIVTKADANTIYEIDYMLVENIYKYYLGNEIVNDFPVSVIEFPLVKIDDGVHIARSVVNKNKNGGYIYAGHFKVGDRVKFAIGNIENVLSKASYLYNSVAMNPAEATFIYSSSARKMFMGEKLNHEFGLIEQVAPTVGFFTYGEFYHGKRKNQLLNITTTTLSLSESGKVNQKEILLPKKYHLSISNTLVNLINVSNKKLSQYKELLDISSIVSKADINGRITYTNDEFCRISGYSREELIGKNHNIVKHPETDRAIYRDMWRVINSKKVWKGTIRNRAKDGSDYYVKCIIMPILNDDGEIVEYISART